MAAALVLGTNDLVSCGFESHRPHYVIFTQGGKSLESLVSSHSARLGSKDKHKIFFFLQGKHTEFTHMFNWWLGLIVLGLMIHLTKEIISIFFVVFWMADKTTLAR